MKYGFLVHVLPGSIVLIGGTGWFLAGLLRPLPTASGSGFDLALPEVPRLDPVVSEAQVVLAVEYNPFHPSRTEIIGSEGVSIDNDAGDIEAPLVPAPLLLGTAVGFDGAQAVLQWPSEPPHAMNLGDERNGYRVRVIRKGAVVLAYADSTITIRLKGDR